MIENLEHLSAQELYELAKERSRTEYEQEKEYRRERLREFRVERREMIKRHQEALRRLQEAQTAELAHLDGKIQEYGGRLPKDSPLQAGAQSLSAERLLHIIGQAPEMSTAQIREEVEREGLWAKNLSQRLVSLKNQGRLEQVRRGVYRLPE